MILFFIADKVEKVSIDLDEKTVLVTSNLPGEELLEVIKKTGKSTQYVGVKEWNEMFCKFRKIAKLKLEV